MHRVHYFIHWNTVKTTVLRLTEVIWWEGGGSTVWSENLFSIPSHLVTIETQTKINECHIYQSVITFSRDLFIWFTYYCIITSIKNDSLFRKRLVNSRDCEPFYMSQVGHSMSVQPQSDTHRLRFWWNSAWLLHSLM